MENRDIANIEGEFEIFFIEDHQEIARIATIGTCEFDDAQEDYGFVIDFLASQPGLAKKGRAKKAPAVGTREYIESHASDFYKGRVPRGLKMPETKPDPAVSELLMQCFDVSIDSLGMFSENHLKSMACENLVGNILEHYVAKNARTHGWIWCSGEMVSAVDFIKIPATEGADYRMLQVKNRDNSENSSSAKVRKGTTIEKWHRTKSKTGAVNWAEFPDPDVAANLNEVDFIGFIQEYIFQASLQTITQAKT